jgi:uracil-DNA glycosylase family 4
LGKPPARTAGDVRREADAAPSLDVLDACITDCFACPRLVAWREEVARVKRASFRHQQYWGRPIPGYGPEDAEIAILGLAPAAHGGNRTGRIFTGDRSGDVLFASLHRVGLVNQPTSVSADDGLELKHLRIFSAVRCAPPDNKPLPEERDNCAPWLHREISLLRPSLRVVVALGAFAWQAWWPAMTAVYGGKAPVPRPKFGHGAEVSQTGVPHLLGSFHVSQQNTFTGRLTPEMLDAVFLRAKAMAGLA